MASKRAISYQWRLFFPMAIFIWVTIVCMYFMQQKYVRETHEANTFERLKLLGQTITASDDLDNVCAYLDYANKYRDISPMFDPIDIEIWDTRNDSLMLNVGTMIQWDEVPTETSGFIDLKDNNGKSVKYIYTVTDAPEKHMRVYTMVPYAKVVENLGTSANTTFWIVFIVLGMVVTLACYLTTRYLCKNLRILRTFAAKASDDSDFVLNESELFPHDELGDISRKIVNIYNQKVGEMAMREREHQVAINAIEEKNRIKRELTGNINHELKTPVGIIQGYIDTIVDNPDMDPATRDRFLLKTRDNIHRLTELIKDVTAITKFESGGKLTNVEEINLHDFVFSLANYIKEGNVMQGKMTFHMDLPLNCNVLANESLLNSAILNLVKNAVAYSQGTECHLVYTGEDDDFYRFRFYDNGVGVPPEHLPHIFERFYRVNAGRARNAGGTGLGLSIVEVTIQSFGGTIEASNHFPSGLEFNFTLKKYEAFKRKKASAATEPQSPRQPLNG